MRTLYDSIHPGNWPSDGDLYGGYVGGSWPTATNGSLAANANGKPIVTIAVASRYDAIVLDVEAGDATPDLAPGWCERQRKRGQIPTVYCEESALPAVRAAFHHANVAEPYYWIASYSKPAGSVFNLAPTVVAHQYGGDRGAGWDISVVADFWPGVDQPAPPAPTEETVNFTTVHATPAGVVATFKGLDHVTDVPVDPKHFVGIKSKTPARYEDGIDGNSIVVYADPDADIVVTFT